MLRGLMSASRLAAYVVPSSDAHASEYVGEHDARRQFLSSFTGSAGTAVITLTEARLWTDGRYYLQAFAQLDAGAGWQLMKDRLPETPSIEGWLGATLAPGELVGVDPSFFSVNALRRLHVELAKRGQRLCSAPGLVDRVWGAAQPPRSAAPLAPHPLCHAGEPWEAKVQRVAAALDSAGADALCISALDEIAWLLNVRGGDVAHCPVGLAYALLHRGAAGEGGVGVVLAVDEAKVTPAVEEHWREGSKSVRIRRVPYEAFPAELAAFKGKVLLDPASASGAIYEALSSSSSSSSSSDSAPASAAASTPGTPGGGTSEAPPLAAPPAPFFSLYLPGERVTERPSPIQLMKAVKNSAEMSGMRAAHLRDAVVLCRFFSWLEAHLASASLTEFQAAGELDALRTRAELSRGLSFDTIMGWKANGAVIHYRPEEATALPIDCSGAGSGFLLCDSGGQYADGTTDVTRTLFLGAQPPTPHHRRAYTAVLQGHINLASAVFPSGTGGVALDALARAPIWAQGLDYRHGTGHGVGAYLNVHEGPQGLASVARSDYAGGLVEGMTITE
jgi:Xaa-Pro aminopeptidase